MRYLWLVLGILTVIEQGYGENRCLGGGDGGGVPFSLVPQGIASNPNYVKTNSLGSDFLLWERTNQIVYIDQWQRHRFHNLQSSQETSPFESQDTSRFSRVVDKENRFFTKEQTRMIYDMKRKHYWQLPYEMGRKELFWHSSTLYSATGLQGPSERQPSRIYAYDAAKGHLKYCRLNLKGIHFIPAEQSAYPFLYGYHQEKQTDGTYRVHSVKIDVRPTLLTKECSVESYIEYRDPFPGPVKAMYHYSGLKANIFHVDHPQKQLLWDLGNDECTFYDLEGQNFSVLRSEAPVVALWSDGEPLNILYPRRTQKRTLPDVGQFGLSPSDFSLSNDGQRLFVSQKPEANSETLKLLYQFELEVIP